MASAQCHKPAEETCHQKCSNHSLGEKVSEITSGWFKGNNHSNSNCTPETTAPAAKPYTTESQCVNKTKGHSHHHASNGVASQGKTAKKRNLFQKIKDGLSGNDSSSDSSGSDSESDNKGCHNRKN